MTPVEVARKLEEEVTTHVCAWLRKRGALLTRAVIPIVVEACASMAERYPSSEYADIPVIRGIAHAVRGLTQPSD